MAGGTWSPTDLPIRPGFYMNFVAAALAAIQSGPRGIVGMPVQANWGPINQMMPITDEDTLDASYNTESLADTSFTAHDCIYLALLGQPQTVLGYRLSDGAAAKGSVTLKDSAATNALKLTTLYESTRTFNATVRPNPVDDVNFTDIVLFEGTTQLAIFTFANAGGIVANAVAAINSNPINVWVVASSMAAGNGSLAAISNAAFTGGNAGIAGIDDEDYTNALSAFEAQTINAIVLDGNTDAGLLTSLVAWVARVRSEGKKLIAYVGGTATQDESIATANTRSYDCNFEGVVNVGVSGILNGVTYGSALVACYIAGLASGQSLQQSTTYAVTVFDDVTPRLTNSQVISALQAGTLVLVYDGTQVVVEQGINTLTSLAENEGPSWKKIKCIRIMDAIAMDTAAAAQTNYIGKILNNKIGQTALLCAIKQYFETLVSNLLDADFTVQTDTAAMADAEGDQFFWLYTATIVDSMEKIFGTGYIS